MCVGSLCCQRGSSGVYRWHCSPSLSGFDPEGGFDHCNAEALIVKLFCLFDFPCLWTMHCNKTRVSPLKEQRGHSFKCGMRVMAKVKRVNQVIRS